MNQTFLRDQTTTQQSKRFDGLYHVLLALITVMVMAISAPALGSANAEPFGLAMHGNPKHGPDSPHLEYVNPNAPKGGEITYSTIGTFDSLNPYAIKGTAANGLSYVYERLMARAWDEPFTLYPLIAESYDVAEDRSWIAFTLNDKARFSDNTPITGDDVIFSFNTLKESGRPNFRRVFELVEKISKPDDRTVRFDLGPGYDRETIMILAIMPVLSKDYWEGRKFDSSTLEIPVTSGPYEITKVDPGSEIVYKRRDDYWGKNLFITQGQYNFETITYDYYRDKNVAYESFLGGEIDFWREDDASRWNRLKQAERKSFIAKTFSHSRPEKVNAFIFNTRREPFDDIRVRRALSLAFNAGWINKTLYSGQMKRIKSFYPNSELAAKGRPDSKELALLKQWEETLPQDVFGPAYEPAHNSDNRQLRKNLRKATALLEESGWIIKNGKRVHSKTEKPFEFEIILNDTKAEKIGLALIRNLKKLGIEVSLRVLDSSAFIGRLNEYNYDMVLHYWHSTLSPGTEQILFWGCEAAEQPARWNYAGICSEAIDSLALQIANSKSREELITLTHALDRALTHGYYMIPLFYRGEDWVSYWPPLQYPEATPIYGTVQESWWQNPKNTDMD